MVQLYQFMVHSQFNRKPDYSMSRAIRRRVWRAQLPKAELFLKAAMHPGAWAVEALFLKGSSK
jgi:hypothetical protein